MVFKAERQFKALEVGRNDTYEHLKESQCEWNILMRLGCREGPDDLGLLSHDKDFGFHPKSGGKPLRSFEQ